jgi:hypothetical protein
MEKQTDRLPNESPIARALRHIRETESIVPGALFAPDGDELLRACEFLVEDGILERDKTCPFAAYRLIPEVREVAFALWSFDIKKENVR